VRVQHAELPASGPHLVRTVEAEGEERDGDRRGKHIIAGLRSDSALRRTRRHNRRRTRGSCRDVRLLPSCGPRALPELRKVLHARPLLLLLLPLPLLLLLLRLALS